MGTPLITIFVRHKPACKYFGDEFNKTCRCRKHLRWSKGGKQYRKQAGTRSWEEAQRVAADLTDQLAGRVSVKRATDAKTLTEAKDAFLKGKKVKKIAPSTYARYEIEIARLVRFAEGRGVFTVPAIDLELLTDYKMTWPEQCPSSTTQHTMQLHLKVFLNYCKQAGWLPVVPKLDPVKIVEPPTTPLTESEFERVLAKAKTPRVRSIILLMRWSGLANRDAACLLRSAFLMDKQTKRAHVITARQKTGVHVRVPIRWDIAEDIMRAANKGGEYLFYDGNATLINFGKIQGQHISWVFARAGVRGENQMVSHRLRDTFAVDLLSKGVPMEEVSKMLGHRSISTTERHYAQWAKVRQDRLDTLVSATWKK
jgi:integrase/recombinase XerD